MGITAWIFGILGGLCAVMGIVTATEVILEYTNLSWMFWMILSGLLLLATIAFTLSRGDGFD